jgi:hypothetical protein
LTLADIERWDLAAITTVFEAVIKRSRGTRTTLILDTHANACDALRRATEKSGRGGRRDQTAAARDPRHGSRSSPDDQRDDRAALPPADLSSYS